MTPKRPSDRPVESPQPSRLRSPVGVVLIILFCLLLALTTIAILRPVLLGPTRSSSSQESTDGP
jgi:hypothetical protein